MEHNKFTKGERKRETSKKYYNTEEKKVELEIRKIEDCTLLKAGLCPKKEKKTGLGTPFFSVRYVTSFYVLKKEFYVLFRSFLEFLATYGTQKNVTFFSVLF